MKNNDRVHSATQTSTVAFHEHHMVEIVVHIKELLDAAQRHELKDHLESVSSIRAAEFCPLRFHLLLVQYDRERMQSQDVLDQVRSRNIQASLVGPV